MQPIDPAAEFIVARDDELRRRRRRRGTDVGDEIGDGHVALVTDRRDHRHRRSRDHPRDDFLVERPEVFDRSAATADDDHVDAWHASNRAQRLSDFSAADRLAQHPGEDRQHVAHLRHFAQVHQGRLAAEDDVEHAGPTDGRRNRGDFMPPAGLSRRAPAC